ncbi:ATP-binding protein [Hydrogenobaculum acidophilum]
MEKRWFRKKLFVNRTNEIKFFMDLFETIPERILWIYGPKSAGKTTLIEYIIENELFEDFEHLKPKNGFWVKYINFRRYTLINYDSFLKTFIKPDNADISFESKINLGIFQLKANILKKVEEKEIDLFNALIDQIDKISKTQKPIIIIDEIQTLQDIYLNGEKELIKEFLNFLVSLTKELHLAHVLILSSNTIFIDQIYNDAKLKVTSDFYKIDHLSYENTHGWLKEEEEFKDDEIALIWDYLGGCIPYLYEIVSNKNKIENLKAYLEQKAFLAYTEIADLMIRHSTKEEDEIFRMIAKEILKNGYFILDPNMERRKEIMNVIDKLAQKEILFYDPTSLKVNGNNRTYEKGMEILLSK